MTAHLTSLAVQRPTRRLDGNAVAAAWGRRAEGEVAVCGPDEDALTLAVAAASRLPDVDADVVVFAATAPPRPEASSAATAALALGLTPRVRTLDLTGPPRCVAGALSTAADLVAADPACRVLVLAGDDRRVPHDHPDEAVRGHAGMAALVSSTPGAAELLGLGSAASASPDRWRDEHGAVRSAGERFLAQAVWPDLLDAAATDPRVEKAVMEAVGVHVAAGNAKVASRLASRIGAATVGADPRLWELGDAGALMAGLVLAGALRDATPGDVHLVVAVGSGVDVLAVRAGEQANTVCIDDGEPAVDLPYGLYLRHAGRTVVGPSRPDASPVTAWRDTPAVVGLEGAECQRCGARAYPRWTSCPTCGDPGPGVPVRMAGTGRLVTYTIDHLVAGVNAGTPESPTTMAVVELDEGGRLFLPTVPGMQPVVGQRLRTVFRVAHDGGGFRHHHWRVAPLHEEASA